MSSITCLVDTNILARCCWHRPWLAPAPPPATAPSRYWSTPSHNPDRSLSGSWFAPSPRLRWPKVKGARVRSPCQLPPSAHVPRSNAVRRVGNFPPAAGSDRRYPLLWAPVPSGCAENIRLLLRCRPSRGARLAYKTPLRSANPNGRPRTELSLLAVIPPGSPPPPRSCCRTET